MRSDQQIRNIPQRRVGRKRLFREYIERRKGRPHFANARSVRNALDRARLRQASRLLSREDRGAVSRNDLMTLEAADIRASRVFSDLESTT